jgi:hypothetical protein
MKPNEENVKAIYTKMEAEGWDTTSPLKWGFFFYSDTKQNLKDIYLELADHEYQIEDLRKNSDGEWILHVSKIEALASQKLHRRNIAFNELADAYDSFYDGWDVGKDV